MGRLVVTLVALQTLADANVPIRLALESREDRDRGQLLTVSISNIGTKPVTGRGTGIITLREQSGDFWAPFNLITGRPIERNAMSALELAAGERRTISIALSELRWGRENAALWPFQALDAVVPAATYDATVKIDGGVDGSPESNAVKITIRDGSYQQATAGGVPAGTSADDTDAFMRFERAWNDAHVRGDVPVLETLCADDMVVTVPGMAVMTKMDILGFWRSGRAKITRYETSEVRVRVSGDMAVVIGRLQRTRDFNGRVLDDDWRFTKTYVRRDGRWQVVAYHASTAAP